MGWQDDARRLTTGQRHELSTFPQFWIVPKKYSIAARDEIQAAMREVQKGIDKKAIAELYTKMRQLGGEITEDRILEVVTPDELAAFMENNSVSVKKAYEIKLRNGIASHNFEGSTVEQLAHDILEFADIAVEMLKIIEDFNRPLPKATSSTSGTSPSGSTKEASSSTETSTRADESQPF
jgi:hypothetical protein